MKRLILPKVDHWLAMRRDHYERCRRAIGDDAATDAELESFGALFREMLAREPRTMEDLVLLAEITIHGCDTGLLDEVYPDDLAAEAATGYTDVVTHACLTRGVLNLLGGQTDQSRRTREIDFARLQRKERRTP